MNTANKLFYLLVSAGYPPMSTDCVGLAAALDQWLEKANSARDKDVIKAVWEATLPTTGISDCGDEKCTVDWIDLHVKVGDLLSTE